MPIHVEWDNYARTAARWTFVGEWSWQEFHEAKMYFNNMLGDIEHTVDVIADMKLTQSLPPHSMAGFQRQKTFDDPRQGRIIIAGGNSYVRSMLATISQTFTGEIPSFHFASTVEEAHTLLS